MRMKRASEVLGLLALTLIASPSAVAQDSGFYVGANIGKTRAKIDDDKILSNLRNDGYVRADLTDFNRDTGYKAFFGYQFNKYFALEAGYFDLGRFGFAVNTDPDGRLVGRDLIRGVNFDGVVSLPFTEKFSIFGRAGLNNANVQGSFVETGAIHMADLHPSKRETNYKFGGGLEYDFTKCFGVRAEVERYRVNDALETKGDIDFASVGVLFRFGCKTAAPVQRVAEPEPIAAAPEPVVVETPVLVLVPVPAETQEYCTILDIQFEIDKDEMQREEKEKLAVLGTFMTKYPNTTALIEGHTDNVGAYDHNLKLSQDRAQNVVNYLVDNLHIAASRLKAVGYGDARPIADNATEEGKRLNRRIDAVVACVTDVEGLLVVPARMTMALLMEFDRNKADIRPQYDGDLRRVANFLKANPSATATVEGHTGNLQGTPALAMEISQRRAQNVVNYLVNSFGIERSRLTAEGFGKTRRYAYNTTVEGQQENRRVNIIINYRKNK